jgi:hypothetical protein
MTFPPPPEEAASHDEPHPSSITDDLDDEWPEEDQE